MMQKFDLSIVICTYNRAGMLEDVIKGLYELRIPDDLVYEIIVIDNNSTDNTRHVVKHWQSIYKNQLRYLGEERQGLSHARNMAINASRGEWLWFLDDDIYFDENWLQGVADAVKNNPEATSIAGKVLLEFEKTVPRWMPEIAYDYYGMTRFGDNPRQLYSGEYPIGANMAVRKIAFKCIGEFNSSLGRVGNKLISWEETEFFQRLYNSAGVVVYTPHAIVRHRITKKQLSRLWLVRRFFSDGLSQVIAENANVTRNRKQLSQLAMNRLSFVYKGIRMSQLSFEHILKYVKELGKCFQYLVYAARSNK